MAERRRFGNEARMSADVCAFMILRPYTQAKDMSVVVVVVVVAVEHALTNVVVVRVDDGKNHIATRLGEPCVITRT